MAVQRATSVRTTQAWPWASPFGGIRPTAPCHQLQPTPAPGHGKGLRLGFPACRSVSLQASQGHLLLTPSTQAPDHGHQAQVIHLPAGTCPGQIPAGSFLQGLDVDGPMTVTLGFVSQEVLSPFLVSVLSSVNQVSDPKSLKAVMAGKPL